MNRVAENDEYLSSAVLIICHEDSAPSAVSQLLEIIPDQEWEKNENCEWSGWKSKLPEALHGQELPEQILYWTETLKNKKEQMQSLAQSGWHASLNCFVTPHQQEKGTASIPLEPEILAKLSELNIELRLSFSS